MHKIHLFRHLSFLLLLGFSVMARAASAPASVFEGEWICLNTALNNPQKNITRTITKVNDEYQSVLKGLHMTMTQTFVLKGEYLVHKDAPENGLMMQEDKLVTTDFVDGKPVKPALGQIVCEKTK